MKMSLALLLVIMSGIVAAQSSPQASGAQPVGHVNGVIICSDTSHPARFASVQLLSEAAATRSGLNPPAGTSGADIAKFTADFGSALKSLLKGVLNGSDLSTLSGLDGTFALDSVPPGTYYAIVQFQGYASPLAGLTQEERLTPDAGTLKAIAGQAQKVVVRAEQTTDIHIDLHRGASLDGTVTYSDGSPAANVTPQLLMRAADGSWRQLAPSGPLPTTTDDHGNFRFVGLLPGQYAVKAALPTEQPIIGIGFAQMSAHLAPGDALVAYSGGASRDSEVKPIELAADGSRASLKITFPLDGLHTISGVVRAEQDQHPVNAGAVELQDPNTKLALRTLPIRQDGTFTLHYVQVGAYLLKVTRASDMQPGADGLPCPLRCKETRRYASTTLPITVTGDVSGVILQVADAGQ